MPPAELVDADYPLYLTTGRLLYHYHTGTMTMLTDGLNKIAPECFVEIARRGRAGVGVQDGGTVHGRLAAAAASRPGSGSRARRSRGRFSCLSTTPTRRQPPDPRGARPVCGIPEFKVCAVKLAKAA